VALAPEQERGIILNTLGVAQYRAGRYHDAAATLRQSLRINAGQFDAFDLYFLAMALHRLGHVADARACLARAVRWHDQHPALAPTYLQELAAFRAEAEGVLAARPELPADVFAGPH
jgi:tetratricopeptide (TPR) repeat protein